MGDNSELATSYHQLQCEFIKVKTLAMKVIEKKLKLETSLRDHQQVCHTAITYFCPIAGAVQTAWF